MAVIASIFVALAALLHGYIFLMESVWWTRPSTWKRFGVADQAAADTTRPMAYNQGFYNLFLAIGAALGVALAVAGDAGTGRPIMLFACGSMVAAGIVLVTHNPRFVRSAAIQIVPPLVALTGQVLFG